MSSLKSDDEIDALLNHKNNTLHKVGVQVKIIGSGNHGNQRGNPGVTPDQNKDNHATVAVTAELIGTQAASKLFNMNDRLIGRYRRGNNGDNTPDPELTEKVEEKLTGISKKITDKVDLLLDIFAEDKMSELKPGEIPSSVDKLISAQDRINRRHEKLGDNGNNRPQVILYAPKQINIDQYITKEV